MSAYYSDDNILSRVTGPVSDTTRREMERRQHEARTNEIVARALRVFDEWPSRNTDDGEKRHISTRDNSMRASG